MREMLVDLQRRLQNFISCAPRQAPPRWSIILGAYSPEPSSKSNGIDPSLSSLPRQYHKPSSLSYNTSTSHPLGPETFSSHRHQQQNKAAAQPPDVKLHTPRKARLCSPNRGREPMQALAWKCRTTPKNHWLAPTPAGVAPKACGTTSGDDVCFE